MRLIEKRTGKPQETMIATVKLRILSSISHWEMLNQWTSPVSLSCKSITCWGTLRQMWAHECSPAKETLEVTCEKLIQRCLHTHPHVKIISIKKGEKSKVINNFLGGTASQDSCYRKSTEEWMHVFQSLVSAHSVVPLTGFSYHFPEIFM